MMAWIWTGIVTVSVIYGIISGNYMDLGNAAIEGAKSAVEICIGLCGTTCLWCGILEIMKDAKITDSLARLFSPIICFILPETRKNITARKYIAANISANLLGVGNAATPAGIKAMYELNQLKNIATNDMCTFTVMNSASIQLIPITVAAIRTSLGAQNAFDILPAVWITSLISAISGIVTSKLLANFSKC